MALSHGQLGFFLPYKWSYNIYLDPGPLLQSLEPTKVFANWIHVFFGQELQTRWWQLKDFLMFIPKIGEMIQFDDHIFQMGWFNHQPAEK